MGMREKVEQSAERAHDACERTPAIAEREVDQNDTGCRRRLAAVTELHSPYGAMDHIDQQPVGRRVLGIRIVGLHHRLNHQRAGQRSLAAGQIADRTGRRRGGRSSS